MEIDIEKKIEEFYWAFYNKKLFEKAASHGLGVSTAARQEICSHLVMFCKEVGAKSYDEGYQDAREEMGVHEDDDAEFDPVPDSSTIHPTDMRRSVGLSVLNAMLTSGAANEFGTDILVGRSIAIADHFMHGIEHWPKMLPSRKCEKDFIDAALKNAMENPLPEENDDSDDDDGTEWTPSSYQVLAFDLYRDCLRNFSKGAVLLWLDEAGIIYHKNPRQFPYVSKEGYEKFKELARKAHEAEDIGFPK